MKIKTQNLKEFNAVAQEFTQKHICRTLDVRKAFVCGLYGDLGAGKTHFVKAVARELGIKTKVNSPTFVIMKRYIITPPSLRTPPLRRRGKKFKTLYHLDAYRLKDEKEILNLGFKELINNPENLIFIEWPENIKKALPKKYLKVKIKHLEGEKREISY